MMKCLDCGREMKDLGDEYYCPKCCFSIRKFEGGS